MHASPQKSPNEFHIEMENGTPVLKGGLGETQYPPSSLKLTAADMSAIVEKERAIAEKEAGFGVREAQLTEAVEQAKAEVTVGLREIEERKALLAKQEEELAEALAAFESEKKKAAKAEKTAK